MDYGNRESSKVAASKFRTPVLDSFVSVWHSDFPVMPPIAHRFTVESHITESDDEIMRIQLKLPGKSPVFPHQHGIKQILRTHIPEFLRPLLPTEVEEVPRLLPQPDKLLTLPAPPTPFRKIPILPFDIWQYTTGRKTRARELRKAARHHIKLMNIR